MFLSKEQILAAADLKFEVVAVPEWGGDVRIRSMTGSARDEFEAAMFAAKGPDETLNLQNVRARMISLSVVDEQGVRLFSEADIQALGEKSGAALERVYARCTKLNAISKADVGELVKN
jgi:hypothetical protein